MPQRPRYATAPLAPGFTLVELLVVVAIIGLLLSLLMPAVQAARGSAYRASCANNLHQIGLAMQHYHLAHGSFPAGVIECRDVMRRGRALPWSAFVLPYLEAEPIYEMIDFQRAFDAPENAAAAATIVPAYVCPATPRTSLRVEGRAVTDYGGIFGEAIAPNPTDGTWQADNGVLIRDRGISIREIRDGTSKTLMVSEDSEWGDGQWINGHNIFDVKHPINYVPEDPWMMENEIRSEHPRGANGLLCDGSVRFLDQDMDLRILEAICTRAGHEVVGEF